MLFGVITKALYAKTQTRIFQPFISDAVRF